MMSFDPCVYLTCSNNPMGDHRRGALLFCTKYSVCRLLRCTAGTFEAVRCRVLMTQCGLNGAGTEKMML